MRLTRLATKRRRCSSCARRWRWLAPASNLQRRWRRRSAGFPRMAATRGQTKRARWPRSDVASTMPAARNRRVAILGGGIAGLAAAWALTDGGGADEFDVV